MAKELDRAASCLDDSLDDMIDFFDEVNKTLCVDYKRSISRSNLFTS